MGDIEIVMVCKECNHLATEHGQRGCEHKDAEEVPAIEVGPKYPNEVWHPCLCRVPGPKPSALIAFLDKHGRL